MILHGIEGWIYDLNPNAIGIASEHYCNCHISRAAATNCTNENDRDGSTRIVDGLS